MLFKSILLFILISISLLNAKSILYKVSSDSNNVYILGSVHLAKPELYPLNKEIDQAYNNSNILVVEIDAQNPESQMYIQMAMLQLGIYQDNRSLKTELSSKTYRQLQEYTTKAGISFDVLNQMRPWMVMLQLSVVEMLRLGYSPELGIDKYFIDKAKEDKKTVLEIESIESQILLLSRNDKEYQDKLLRYTIESMHEIEPMLESMFDCWQKGDSNNIEKIFLQSMKGDKDLDEIYDELITKRNNKMTKKILNYLKDDKNYFVVVGAGHVVGQGGIIDLLKKHGYEVSQE